jgi:hypothetical protein
MFPAESYDPDTLKVLTSAFENAWKEVQSLIGVRPVAPQVLRAKLANRIMVAANAGERDQSRLKLIALGAIDIHELVNPPRPMPC